jgi:hypothetical protein
MVQFPAAANIAARVCVSGLWCNLSFPGWARIAAPPSSGPASCGTHRPLYVSPQCRARNSAGLGTHAARPTAKHGVVTVFADCLHLIYIFSVFPPRASQSVPSQGGWRSINTWHKQGQNSVSISWDGQGCTQKYEVELRQRNDGLALPWGREARPISEEQREVRRSRSSTEIDLSARSIAKSCVIPEKYT